MTIEAMVLDRLVEQAGRAAVADAKAEGMRRECADAAQALLRLAANHDGLKGRHDRLAEKAEQAADPIRELYEAAQSLAGIIETEHGRHRAPRIAAAVARLTTALNGAFNHVDLIPF